MFFIRHFKIGLLTALLVSSTLLIPVTTSAKSPEAINLSATLMVARRAKHPPKGKPKHHKGKPKHRDDCRPQRGHGKHGKPPKHHGKCDRRDNRRGHRDDRRDHRDDRRDYRDDRRRPPNHHQPRHPRG